jgi:hypothetical protein
MIQQICKWCGVVPVEKHQTYCSKRCRQAAYRFRRLSHIEATARESKRLAYADPPYPGMAKKYYQHEDTYQGEVDHERLLEQLATYDGWALSTSSKALRDILPLCPSEVRVCAWVKPIGASPRTRGLHSTWEPLIVKQARVVHAGVRDWISAQPARFGGRLMGRKPIAFCAFLFQALAAAPGDSFDDLFPGTGIVSASWREFASSSAGDDSVVGAPQQTSSRAACGSVAR